MIEMSDTKFDISLGYSSQMASSKTVQKWTINTKQLNQSDSMPYYKTSENKIGHHRKCASYIKNTLKIDEKRSLSRNSR